MNGTADDNGFELLASVRRLERRLRRLRDEWSSFRDEPSAAALAVLRAQVARLATDLADLTAGVGGAESTLKRIESAERDRAEPTSRPAAREVVRASRELDAWIWQAAVSWKEVIERPGVDRLRALVRILVRCARRSVTLLEALGAPAPGDLRSPRRPPEASAGPAADRIEALSRELEGFIWRLQADWHHVRRSPTADRVRVLCSELAEAAAAAENLRREVETTGDDVFRRSVRVGLHSADTVRFLPYRDPFTGVYSREAFDALAAAELKRCRRYGRRFGLLLIRITASDLASLRALVAATRAELRGYDLISRYAPDLLAIGIPEGGSGASRRVASRVLRAIRRSGFTASFSALAIASLPEDGSTLSGLLGEAMLRLGDDRQTPYADNQV